MSSLAQQRCFNHALREAAARCPQCGHSFCRECIVDHEDRVICASCLRQLTSTPVTARASLAWLVGSVQLVSGLLLVWLFFYWLGAGLLSLSTSSHETKVWKTPWLEQP